MKNVFGGIEAGGTKFVCVIANGPEEILFEERFPTTTPTETIQKSISFFEKHIKEDHLNLLSLGIGTFGPIDLHPTSGTYGIITSTPKPGWANADIVKPFQKAFHIPIAFDTDVNAAAIGEGVWGVAQGLENFLYFTIGTGVGGGAIINGKPLHGLVHPEMGHIRLSQNTLIDAYPGKCPFHGTCFEGLTAGPAIEDRWGKAAFLLSQDHPAWDLEADYIAQAMSNFICTLSPQKIILGGGVMQQTHLFPLIRKKTLTYLNGYVQSAIMLENIDNFIVPPGLGNQAGMLGAIAMAKNLFE